MSGFSCDTLGVSQKKEEAWSSGSLINSEKRANGDPHGHFDPHRRQGKRNFHRPSLLAKAKAQQPRIDVCCQRERGPLSKAAEAKAGEATVRASDVFTLHALVGRGDLCGDERRNGSSLAPSTGRWGAGVRTFGSTRRRNAKGAEYKTPPDTLTRTSSPSNLYSHALFLPRLCPSRSFGTSHSLFQLSFKPRDLASRARLSHPLLKRIASQFFLSLTLVPRRIPLLYERFRAS